MGYVIKYNDSQETQVRDRIKKGAAILEQIWGIGKRRFARDWRGRIWLFDKLIWTVISYGVELWEWKQREGIERLHEIFKMGKGSGKKYSRLYNEGGNTKRDVEGKGGFKGMGVREETGGGKGRRASKDMLGRNEEEGEER